MPTSSHYLRLLYVSRASQVYSREALNELLANSVANNKRENLTGLLCYKHQCFAQILEGEEQTVLRRFLRIAGDPRHSDVTLLSISTVSEPLFSKWKMGYLGEMDLLNGSWDKILALRVSSELQIGEMMRRWLILLEKPQN